MKKSLLMIIPFAAVMLVSCGKSEKPQGLDKSFECKAVITQDETEYKADLERVDGVGWKAVFTSPETIEGLEISYVADECTLSFKGFTYTQSRDELPKFGLADMVMSAADGCINGNTDHVYKDGKGYMRSGNLRGVDFEAHQQGSHITQITFSDGLSAELSDYSK